MVLFFSAKNESQQEVFLKNILLMGGAGFLGVNIAISLVQKGFNVFLLDRKCQHLRTEKYLADVSGFFDENVANAEAILRLVDDGGIDCVINLVSTLIPSSGFQEFSLDIERCTLPAFRMLPELANRGVKYVFFSSGGTVYGQAGAEAGLMSELNPCQPVNLYGYGKWMFEEYIGLCGRVHSLDHLIIRPSNPYGLYQNPMRAQGFIAVAMHKLLKGETIEIWGDGSVVRDYIWVTDMANAFISLLACSAWNEVFNIGSGIGYSLLEVLTVMEQVTGKKAKVVHKASRSVDVSRIVLDVAKLQATVDYEQKSLADGINIYYEGLMSAAI